MPKITSWNAAKTSIINVDERPVAVDTLPPEIRFDIETFDRYKQEYLDVMYREEQMHLLINAKLVSIQTAIRKLLEAQKAATEAAKAAEGNKNES